MLASHALEVLALRPGATASEVKEAYRDLVKVWHPDRFGSDVRLRQKAEDKLKQINEAYRVLQADSGAGNAYSASSATTTARPPSGNGSTRATYGQGTTAQNTSGPSYSSQSSQSASAWPGAKSSSPAPQRPPARPMDPNARVMWGLAAFGVCVILLIGFLALRDRLRGQSVGDVGSSGSSATTQPVTPAPSAPDHAANAHPETKPRPKDTPNGTQAEAFQVRTLTEAENERIEAACARQRQLHGTNAFHACLKAQLDLLAHSTSAPDLTGLSAAERDSVESTCAAARRRSGPSGFNRCAADQLAKLAAEPTHPDLSRLSDTDRRAIDSACATAKNSEGPAAYNRCVDRFTKTLASAK